MNEQNLTMLYKGKQIDVVTSANDCEYTDCKSRTEKLVVIDSNVWQFCQKHFNIVLNAFCRVEQSAGSTNGIF